MGDPTNVVGQRVGAFLIDSILIGIFNFIVFFALAQKQSDILKSGDFDLDTTFYGNITLGDEEYSLYGGRWAAYLVIVLIVGFIYWVVLPGVTGATLGKRMVGIRVVGQDGNYAGIGRNLIRQILWVVDSLPWLIPYLLGFILALVTKGHRRVGDMAGGTYVIKAAAVGQPVLQPAFAGGGGFPQQQFAPQPQFQPPPAQQQQPAGWYPDPQQQARLRYWDGTAWTGNVSN
jgi:uncharacterized RDD family membrane protein YckC